MKMRPGGGSSSGGGGPMKCQDCRTQAKKDCSHMRCRTCCRKRGIHCKTHVKSTWISRTKRRERQLQLGTMQELKNLQQRGDHQNLQRNRENPSSSSLARIGLPSSISAVCKFTKLGGTDGTEEQDAYWTILNVGGFTFKGTILASGTSGGCDTSSGIANGSHQPPLPPLLNLTGTTAVAAAPNQGLENLGAGDADTSSGIANGSHQPEPPLLNVMGTTAVPVATSSPLHFTAAGTTGPALTLFGPSPLSGSMPVPVLRWELLLYIYA